MQCSISAGVFWKWICKRNTSKPPSPPCLNGRLEPRSSFTSTNTESRRRASQAGTGVRWSSSGRATRHPSEKVGAGNRGRKKWGEGNHHKLNISCLMYHLLIQFITGEGTGVLKRTHEPPHVYLFYVDVVAFQEVDLFSRHWV